MRLGTWLAVTYAVPRQPAPTLCENTRVRISPSARDSAVRPAMSTAPRAIPAARPAPAGCSSDRGGCDRPVSLVCTGNSRSPSTLACGIRISGSRDGVQVGHAISPVRLGPEDDANRDYGIYRHVCGVLGGS